jgi:ABC-type multidrug transport system ATPase subunit
MRPARAYRPRVTATDPLLEFRGVARTWRAGILGAASEVAALRDCSFSMLQGEVVAVTGAAGAGKSTLLLLAAAQAIPTAGTVRWCGVHDASRARPQLIGARPWEYNFLTVRQALAFHADQLALRDAALPRTTRFVPLMRDVGLRGMSRVRLGQLSAIDQLRVVVAQALLAEPRLLCCEEPMGFCGPRERLEAVRLLRMVADRGIALLVATREETTLAMLGVADRTLRLVGGRVTEDATSRRTVLELAVPRPDDAYARLASRLPSMSRRGRRLRVPLGMTTPEAVLAACRDVGVEVRASRVAEERVAGDAPPA